MGPIIILIILWIQNMDFRRLVRALPNAETQRMLRNNKIALYLYIFFNVLNLVPYILNITISKNISFFFFIISLAGVFIALGFAYQAVRIKRRLGPKEKIQELLRSGTAMLKEDARPQELFERAVKIEVKGEHDKAISLYREIIEKYPSSKLAIDSRSGIEALEKRKAQP